MRIRPGTNTKATATDQMRRLDLAYNQAKLTKKQIRSTILLRLKTQKEENREKKSRSIAKKLLRTLVFKRAKRVVFYISFDGEVNTAEMIECARRLGKIIAVPHCRRNGLLTPVLCSPRMRLKRGLYGVAEPARCIPMNIRDIDLVIVPGVAFDKKGGRVGRGKGCYDRFLKMLPAGTPTIGLAFDFQILPSVPVTEHDVSVDRVIFA